MCGGEYPKFKTPKQLLKINGEVIVERTIRQLRENGITDIAVSTNNPKFDYLDVELLHNKKNKFVTLSENEVKESAYSWLNAYYPINEPVCYLHGDVYFSDEAIKTIVQAQVEDTMFFCVPDKWDVPNKSIRNIKGREPLAYKVQNYKHFRAAVDDLLKMVDEGKFKEAKCSPIAWTVYRYLNGLDVGFKAQNYGDLNDIFRSKGDYIIINDYTTDVDSERDIKIIEKLSKAEGGNMIKVEVIEEFTYGDFYKIKDTLVRHSKEKEGWLYKGDTFECDEPTLAYLTGANKFNKTVVKVIEVVPEVTVGYSQVLPTDQTGEEETFVDPVETITAELRTTKKDPEPKKAKKTKKNK